MDKDDILTEFDWPAPNIHPFFDWGKAHNKLKRMKEKGEAVMTTRNATPNEIIEVGQDYVIVASSITGHPRKITALQIETLKSPNRCIKEALFRLGKI